MNGKPKIVATQELEQMKLRRRVAMHLQQIEDNPLSQEDAALFEMFDREGWSQDERITHILERARVRPFSSAAE